MFIVFCWWATLYYHFCILKSGLKTSGLYADASALLNRRGYRVQRSVLWQWSRIYNKTSRFEMSHGDWRSVQIWLCKTLPCHQESMLRFLLADIGWFWCECFLVSLWICACLRFNASSSTYISVIVHTYTSITRVARYLVLVMGDHAKLARRLCW